LAPAQTNNATNIPLAIMSVFQAIPFDASYNANEPLIAHGDAEEEDHGLEEKALSRFKSSSLLLGFIVGSFMQFSLLGANLIGIILWGKDVVNKSKTSDIIAFSLLWSYFTAAMAIAMLGFLRNLVTITYSAVPGRSKDLLEEMLLHMECRFGMGALLGVCGAWTMTYVLLDMRAQIVNSLLVTLMVVLFWFKIMGGAFPKIASRHRPAEPCMMAV
jgi:uncharacterized protein with PQ loop repeat